MKNTLLLLFKIFTIIFALSVHGQNFITVTKSNAGQIFNLTNNQVLEIELPGNPSTGYGWYITNIDNAVITQIGNWDFLPVKSIGTTAGQPGTEVARFIGVSQGTSNLILEYKRPWEKEKPPVDNLVITVISNGKYTGNYIPAKPQPKKHITSTPKSVPSTFSWQYQCTPVKNQEQCGACWAFASCGSFEAIINIRDHATRDLSEQWLVNCATNGGDCSGGWCPNSDWQTHGAVYESDEPYVASVGICKANYPYHEKIDTSAYIIFGTPTDAQIKQAIYNYGPVWTCIYAGKNFTNYTGGIFDADDGGNQINHTIVLVGWDDNGGNGYWILKNSWGTGWGESGYMRIKYGVNLVGAYTNYIVYKGGIPFNIPPVAGFFASQTFQCMPPASITFTNTCYNANTFLWDFGDGSTDNTANPTHTYTTSGTFDVKLKVTNSYGSDSLTKISFIIINTAGPLAASCNPATLNNCCGTGISNVTFNTINNATSNNNYGYHDYTCTISTTVAIGQEYTLNIQTNPNYPENAGAWIDYNNDGIFEPSEQVLNSSNNYVHTSIITIPATATKNVPLRMRIGSDYYYTPSPCTDAVYGQFEDYSVTIVPAPPKTLTLKVFLEGFYKGSGMMRPALDASFHPKWDANITDTLTVELHDINNYDSIVYSAYGVKLNTDGTATILIPVADSGVYYIAVNHRNHLKTVSANIMMFESTSNSYDFTEDISMAFWDNQKNINGAAVIFAGDITSSGYDYPGPGIPDGSIDISDVYYVFNSYLNGDYGYLLGDISGDGTVDLTDVYLAFNNFLLGVYSVTP